MNQGAGAAWWPSALSDNARNRGIVRIEYPPHSLVGRRRRARPKRHPGSWTEPSPVGGARGAEGRRRPVPQDLLDHVNLGVVDEGDDRSPKADIEVARRVHAAMLACAQAEASRAVVRVNPLR